VTFQVDPNLTQQQVEQVQQLICHKVPVHKVRCLLFVLAAFVGRVANS